MNYKNYCYYYIKLIKDIEEFKENNYNLMIKIDNYILFRRYCNKMIRLDRYYFINKNIDNIIKNKAYNILEKYIVPILLNYHIINIDEHIYDLIINSLDFKIYNIFKQIIINYNNIGCYIYNIHYEDNNKLIKKIIETKDIKIIKYFDNLLKFNKKNTIYLNDLISNNIIDTDLILPILKENEYNNNNLIILIQSKLINNLEILTYLTKKLNSTKYMYDLHNLKNIDCFRYIIDNNLVNKKYLEKWIRKSIYS